MSFSPVTHNTLSITLSEIIATGSESERREGISSVTGTLGVLHPLVYIRGPTSTTGDQGILLGYHVFVGFVS